MAPPARALVLCVDEKPQIQAVARTAPVLPMRPGQPERVLRSVRICPIKGLGSLTKTQREFRAKQIVQESGADDLGNVREAAAVNRTVTFSEQAEQWLHEMHNRKRDPVKPRTLGNWKSHVAWLLPRVGDVRLPDLTPARARELITVMAKKGLSAKTIKNYLVFSLK